MYKIYRANSGIEFRVGVKTKIFAAIAIIGFVLVCVYINQILEVMISGF